MPWRGGLALSLLAIDLTSEEMLAPFLATRPLALAEHLRLPYAVAGPGSADSWTHSVGAPGRAGLAWPRESELDGPPALVLLTLRDGVQIPVCARLLEDERLRRRLGAEAGAWSPVAPLRDRSGRLVASIWRHRGGGLLLPFDPDEAVLNLWSERYVQAVVRSGRGATAQAMLRAYYAVRQLVPRGTQIWMRRHYARVQARRPFPRWPDEPALHDLIDLFLAMLADVAGRPVPYLAPWPSPHRWAFVLTHDVETETGLEAIEPVLALERALGLRSAWNFVPRRYAVREEQLEGLRAAGCEIGVHGLYHDGRDLVSLARLRERLPDMRAAAERWGAVGFRSPALHRRWDWMPLLGFDYDSSYPDTDPYEPQPGGCCSWWPFLNGGLVELPLTMPQDHTLFAILGHRDESAWVQKAELLRRRGGMALLLTHPDYLTDATILGAYRRLLERYGTDAAAWRALPADVSAWWRRRAASTIVAEGHSLRVAGPAAGEAAIELAPGRAWC